MTHYHVTMTAADADQTERHIPGDHPGVLFRAREQAVSAATYSALTVSTEVRKDGHNPDVTSTGPRWEVSWTDHDGVPHTRVSAAVECAENHDLNPASAGSSDT